MSVGTRPEETMRVLHVINSMHPRNGGPPVIAARIAAAQAAAGAEVTLVAYEDVTPEELRQMMNPSLPGSDAVRVRLVPLGGAADRVLATGATAVLREEIGSAGFVHLHSVWDPILLRAARLCRTANRPYCVLLNGMLHPWSLRQAALKKRIALAVAYRRMLDGAAFLHAGNQDERLAIEPLGLRAPIELIPNGVNEEEFASLPPPERFRREHPGLGENPYILFLSRLHYKKGLDHLAESFRIVAGERKEVHLVVAGADDGAQADFERRIREAGVADRVHIVGPVYGEMKIAALAGAAAFCLPTRQEGFSVAITEALAAGAPCVVSYSANYPEVQEAGAGRVVPLEPAKVAEALLEILGDPALAASMRERGRTLVRERFTWRRIAEQTLSLYARYGGPGSAAQRPSGSAPAPAAAGSSSVR